MSNKKKAPHPGDHAKPTGRGDGFRVGPGTGSGFTPPPKQGPEKTERPNNGRFLAG